ncbi:MAG: helix-turn-helix domain-containing protein [Oscillospiraceae bacterium]|jgi:transcriptional regulator with XRE-family HTH domain
MDQKVYAQILINRIQSLCKKRGITINKLADMSGITTSTIDSLINGRAFNPRIQTLHKIAIAFNMTVAEFLDYEELNEYSFEDTSDEDE